MNEMIEAYKAMWKNYANFNGRTSVRGFWFAMLANYVISLLIGMVFGILIAIGMAASDSLGPVFIILMSIVLGAYTLATIVPQISITVRRLHDAGFSGFMYLLNFVPTVGQIAVIVFCCMQSKEDDTYGVVESQV